MPVLTTPAVRAAWLLAGMTAVRVAAAPIVPPTPAELHDAQCFAALEATADDLTRQWRAGRKDVRTSLRDALNAAYAFNGPEYLAGGADQRRAVRLAAEARTAQRTLPPTEAQARQAACLAEGSKRFETSGGLERAVISRHADERLKRAIGR